MLSLPKHLYLKGNQMLMQRSGRDASTALSMTVILNMTIPPLFFYPTSPALLPPALHNEQALHVVGFNLIGLAGQYSTEVLG